MKFVGNLSQALEFGHFFSDIKNQNYERLGMNANLFSTLISRILLYD